jgi:hypothetical protein
MAPARQEIVMKNAALTERQDDALSRDTRDRAKELGVKLGELGDTIRGLAGAIEDAGAACSDDTTAALRVAEQVRALGAQLGQDAMTVHGIATALGVLAELADRHPLCCGADARSEDREG